MLLTFFKVKWRSYVQGELMIYWYVLFVKTGKEHKIENFIKEKDIQSMFVPFVPILETFFKKKGTVKKETEILFPGYVFIESELNPTEFSYSIKPFIDNNDDVIKVLHYGSKYEIAVKEEERQSLLLLCNDSHSIEASTGVIVGDKICVTEGALAGRESIIKKIDRHKMEALIDLNFMGAVRQVKVALRVVEKV